MNSGIFNQISHLIWGIVIIAISIAIFFKANYLYSARKCPNMLIIAGGFLFGTLLEMLHVTYSVYSLYTPNKLFSQDFEYLYLLASHLFISSSIFISSFYISKKTDVNFKRKIYGIQLCIFLFIVALIEISCKNHSTACHFHIQNIILSNPSIWVLSNILYLLSAFLYLDIASKENKNNIFYLFIAGLFLLGVGQIYIVSDSYTESLYRLIIHIIRVISYTFIFLGIESVQVKAEKYFLRHKILISLVMFILFLQLFFNTVFISIFHIKFPQTIQYIYIGFYIATILFVYSLGKKITKPISNLITQTEKFEPDKKPSQLKVYSNDEIGFLTEKFNERTNLIWDFTERLKASNVREKLLREITEVIRSSIELDKIIHTFVFETGKIFNVTRVFYSKYDSSIDEFLTPDENAEYLSSPDLISHRIYGKTFKDVYPFFKERLKTSNEIIIIPDVEKFIRENALEETADAKTMRVYNTKSVIVVPVRYKDNLLGGYAFAYDKPTDFSPETIDFIKTVSAQTGIAIYQAELYEREKKTAEREKLLRLLSSKFVEDLDINQLKKTITTEICKLFNASRCAIHQININTGKYFIIDEFSEYLSDPSLPSYVGIDFAKNIEYDYFENLYKQKKEYLFYDWEKFLDEIDINQVDVETKNKIKNFQIKSNYIFPLVYQNEFMGTLYLTFSKEKRLLNDEELNLLRTIMQQASLFFYQAKLYEDIKKSAERERILRLVIESIRSTININEIKKIFVTEMGKLFNANRCFIIEFTKQDKIDEYSEYLSSSEIKSFVDAPLEEESYQYWISKAKLENIIIPDMESYIKEQNLVNTPAHKNILEYDIKSALVFKIEYQNRFLGIFTLHFNTSPIHFSDEDLKIINAIVNQAALAFYQAELYEKEKKTAARERILREIIAKTKNSFDLNEIKNSIVYSVGTLMNSNRCFIMEFNPLKKEFMPIENEYRNNEKTKSVINQDPNWEIPELIEEYRRGEIFVNERDSFIAEYKLQNTKTAQFLYNYDIKSGFTIPIYYENLIQGILVLHFDINYGFDEEDVQFIKIFADHAGIVIYQAKLYEDIKKSAERERLLRIITNTIRSYLDINKVKTTIVEEMCKSFKADRCYFRVYDKIAGKFLAPEIEYLSSPDIGSLKDKEPVQEELEFFVKNIKGFSVLEVFMDSVAGTPTENYLREANILCDYAIPLWDKPDELTYLVLHYIKSYPNLEKEDMALMETIARQIEIAINQSELFTKIKITAEREKLLREITEIIRGSLDINEIKLLFLTKIAEFFGSDRCYLTEYDVDEKVFIPLDKYSEVLSSPDVKSNVGDNLEKYKYYVDIVRNRHEVIVYRGEDFINKYNEENLPGEDYVSLFDVKSAIGFPLLYKNELQGLITVQYTKDYHNFTDEELDFLRILAAQAGLAYYQSKLFTKIKITAEREKLLREIIAEIKISQSLNEIYAYITQKVANIYGATRGLFIEIPVSENELPSIKYQYIASENIPELEISQMPLYCLESMLESANKEGISYIRDTREHKEEDENLQDFFKEFNIKGIILISLLRYNHDVKVLGALVLCFDKIVNIKESELDLVKSIAGSTVDVLWEIKKRNELEDLRNVFILTLTHDLQVPLVGEKRALEFIASRPQEQQIGKIHEIIIDLINSNESLIVLLKKLLDTYNYESGQKELNLTEYSVENLINNSVKFVTKLASSKELTIDIEIEKDLPLIMVDYEEIKKVLNTLLENAVDYSEYKGKILIKGKKQKNKVIISVKDNGKGIPFSKRDKIFERYPMALSIERKIGSGLGLYLSKQIVEAHNGNIRFESEVGKGTTFYFSLPIN